MSDLLPASDALYSLGSATRKWKSLYLSNVLFKTPSWGVLEVKTPDDTAYASWRGSNLELYGGLLYIMHEHGQIMIQGPAPQDTVALQKSGSVQLDFLAPDLPGDAAILRILGKILVDTIEEKTADAGVTVDGVLCKDGVIPNAAYPNALLLDGSRAVTGDLTRRYTYLGANFDTIVGVLDENNGLGGGLPSPFFQMGQIDAANNLTVWRILIDSSQDRMDFQSYDYGTSSFQTRFRWYQGRFTAHGNVVPNASATYDFGSSLLAWRDLWLTQYLRVGKVSSLPTASSTHRGKLIRVEGGSGVADTLYICMKSAADTYSWVQVASG